MGHDKELASSATLSRFENSMAKKDISNLFLGMIENFVSRIEEEPNKIVLDFDPLYNIWQAGRKIISWILQRLLFFATACV